MWNKLPCDKREIKDIQRTKYRRSNMQKCTTKDDLNDSLEEGKKKTHRLALTNAPNVTKAMANEMIALETKCWHDPKCSVMA